MGEQEIELVDYLRVIIKRKWIIVGITIGAIIVAGILTFLSPKTYKISAILEIGQINIGGVSASGKIITFSPETPIELQEKIQRGTYDNLLKEKSGIKNLPKIEISAPKDTNFIVMEVESRNFEEGKKILETLADIIIENHSKLLKEQKDFIQEEIKKEEFKVSILEKSKSLPELQYLYVEHLSRIDELKNNLATATETQLIKSPSENPISKSILMNVIIAGLLGIFIGFLLAFFQEFLEKNKERLK